MSHALADLLQTLNCVFQLLQSSPETAVLFSKFSPIIITTNVSTTPTPNSLKLDLTHLPCFSQVFFKESQRKYNFLEKVTQPQNPDYILYMSPEPAPPSFIRNVQRLQVSSKLFLIRWDTDTEDGLSEQQQQQQQQPLSLFFFSPFQNVLKSLEDSEQLAQLLSQRLRNKQPTFLGQPVAISKEGCRTKFFHPAGSPHPTKVEWMRAVDKLTCNAPQKGTHLEQSMFPETCAVVNFLLQRNLTNRDSGRAGAHYSPCPLPAQDEENVIGFINYDSYSSGAAAHIKFPIAPINRRGLEYACFINKSSLHDAPSLTLLEPFDPGCWTAFLASIIAVSATATATAVLLGGNVNGGQTTTTTIAKFISMLTWSTSVFLEQTNLRVEEELRRSGRSGTILLLIWGGCMLVLTNSYTDALYSFMVAAPAPIVPSRWEELRGTWATFSLESSVLPTGIQGLLSMLPKPLQQPTIVKSLRDSALFDNAVTSISYEGGVPWSDKTSARRNNYTKFPKRFILLQRSRDLETFSLLMGKIGRFVEVRNGDSLLVSTSFGWFGSRNVVGEQFQRVLGELFESGIMGVWEQHFKRFLNKASLRMVAYELKKRGIGGMRGGAGAGGRGDKVLSSLSLEQLRTSFLLLWWGNVVGLGGWLAELLGWTIQRIVKTFL